LAEKDIDINAKRSSSTPMPKLVTDVNETGSTQKYPFVILRIFMSQELVSISVRAHFIVIFMLN
jgi:hypothetical protein